MEFMKLDKAESMRENYEEVFENGYEFSRKDDKKSK